MVGFGKNFSRCRYAVYLDRVQRIIPTRGVHLTLAPPEHQEMKVQVKVTWRDLRTIAHSLMIHARVSEAYSHFAFIYMTDHIFPVLPIKDMINEDGYLTKPFKIATGKKLPLSHLRVLFCQHMSGKKR